MPKSIKVVSYNVELGEKIQGAKNLFSQGAALADADIICLQEMHLEAVEEVAGFLRYNYVYYPSAIHPKSRKDFGQAILSKWPIKNDKQILLPFSSEDRYIKIQNAAVAATVAVKEREILIYSAHLGVVISPAYRQAQLRSILDSIPALAEEIIICGDFNTYAELHNKAIQQVINEYRFKEATNKIGWTYKYWYLFNDRAVLDHIFYKGLKLLKAGKVVNRAYSDHLPVWAEFE